MKKKLSEINKALAVIEKEEEDIKRTLENRFIVNLHHFVSLNI